MNNSGTLKCASKVITTPLGFLYREVVKQRTWPDLFRMVTYHSVFNILRRLIKMKHERGGRCEVTSKSNSQWWVVLKSP